jgi:hypothetical protein
MVSLPPARAVGLTLSALTSSAIVYCTLVMYWADYGWFTYDFVTPTNEREMNKLEFGLFNAKQSTFKIMQKSGGLKLKNETVIHNYQCNASSPSICDNSDVLNARLYFQIAIGLAVADVFLCLLLSQMPPQRSFLCAEIYFCQLLTELAFLFLVTVAIAGVAIFVANSSGFTDFDPTKLEYGDQFKNLFICQALGGALLVVKLLVGVIILLTRWCGSRQAKGLVDEKKSS